MKSTNESKTNDLGPYEKLPKLGVGMAAATFSAFMALGMIKNLVHSLHQQALTFGAVLPLVLFGATLLLGFAWYISAEHELSLVARYYGRHAPSRSFGALPVVIGVAVVIVVLAYCSDNLLYYGVVYWLYLAFAASASWLTTQHVLRAMQRETPDDSIPPVVRDEVYRYYVKRPSHVVNFIQGAMASLAVACGFISRQPQMNHMASASRSMGYGLLIAAIVLNELIVWAWRWRLYRRIQEQEDVRTDP